MNRRTSVLVALFIIVLVGGALVVGLSQGKSSRDVCASNSHSAKHIFIIEDGKVSRTNVTGKVCDTMTITNKDSEARKIAFGVHDSHVAYDGISETVLAKNKSLTITFDKVGSYHWHDHLHDEVEGYFTVTN